MEWYDFIPGGRFAAEAFSTATGNASPLTQETYGERPTDANGISNYEYAHATVNRDASGNAAGFSTGLGLTRGKMPWGGQPGQPDTIGFDVLNANLDVGHHIDADGNRAYGLNANANSLRTNGSVNFGPANGPGGFFGWEFGGPEAAAVATASTHTAQGGAWAGYLSGAATLGTRGTEIDESVRLGGFAGAGAAGRLHYGDSDGDGNREYGFGIDAGPILFDYKTEDPLHSIANLASFGMLGIGEGVYNAATGSNPAQRSNWTNRATGALSDLYHWATD
jgi:hypothetical protein